MRGKLRFGSFEYSIDNGSTTMSRATAFMIGSKSNFYDFVEDDLDTLLQKMKETLNFPLVWIRKMG